MTRWRSLARNQDGAVAPTVALSLFALIGVGGLAFDYARLAALDTELQQAADQAALAAATQLDGKAGACGRAAAAASQLLNNQTLFANDGDADGLKVVVPVEATCDAADQVRFYKTWDAATDAPGDEATSPADAKYVQVTVNTRTARYALTPVVGAIFGDAAASAVATLGAGAICKIPPLMMCNPAESSGGEYPTAADIGKGLKLEAGGGTTWAPGNYGYLNLGSTSLEAAMGSNIDALPCVAADDVSTKPGNTASATAGINTRFDIYENGLVGYCERAADRTTKCSPALNVTKDMVHAQFSSGTAPNEVASMGGGKGGKADNCGLLTGQEAWEQVPQGKRYVPGVTTPAAMGLPRDVCHASNKDGSCASGRFGDGNWDRALYFKTNHATAANPSGSVALAAAATFAGKTATATIGTNALSRYDVYRWEMDYWSKNPTVARRLSAGTAQAVNPAGNPTGKSYNVFQYTGPRCAIGQSASETIKDRRVLTAALVNCTAGNVKGSTKVSPIGWVDLFLVEPSITRRDNDNKELTGADQIYVEVIGKATKPNGDANTFQYFLRQRPRLVR